MRWLRQLLCILIVSICIPDAYAQKKYPQRFISYHSLPSYEHSIHFSVLAAKDTIVAAASKGLLNVYHFDSFTKAPRLISAQEMTKKALALEIKMHKPWNKSSNYHPYYYDPYVPSSYKPPSTVVFNNQLFEALAENKNTPPTDSLTWRPVPFSLGITTIGLDFVINERDSVAQFIHLFRDNLKYLASFKASDVIRLLNSKGIVWCEDAKHFAGHVTGDIYLFNSWDHNIMVHDLWPLLDTVKLKVSLPQYESYRLRTTVQFKNDKIDKFILCLENQVYDTIPASLVNRFAEKEAPKLMLAGDALATFKMLKPRDGTPTSFKGLGIAESPVPLVGLKEIFYNEEEDFLFKDQTESKKLKADLLLLLNLTYQGVYENKIQVYKSGNLQSACTAQELVRLWARNKIEKWDSTADYEAGINVLYNNITYLSLASNYKGRPDLYPKIWQANKVSIVQPGNISKITFHFFIKADPSGKIISKEASSIELKFNGSPMGFFDPAEIKKYLSTVDPRFWDRMMTWIRKHGVFEISQTPLQGK